jgi:hypothetical protein
LHWASEKHYTSTIEYLHAYALVADPPCRYTLYPGAVPYGSPFMMGEWCRPLAGCMRLRSGALPAAHTLMAICVITPYKPLLPTKGETSNVLCRFPFASTKVRLVTTFPNVLELVRDEPWAPVGTRTHTRTHTHARTHTRTHTHAHANMDIGRPRGVHAFASASLRADQSPASCCFQCRLSFHCPRVRAFHD